MSSTTTLHPRDAEACREQLTAEVGRLLKASEAAAHYWPPDGVDCEYGRDVLNELGRAQAQVLLNLAMNALEQANIATYKLTPGEVMLAGEQAMQPLTMAAALSLALLHQEFPAQVRPGEWRVISPGDLLVGVRDEARKAAAAVKALSADGKEVAHV